MVYLESIRNIDDNRPSGRILEKQDSLIAKLPTASDIHRLYVRERGKGRMTTSAIVLGCYGIALLLGRVLGSM